MLKDLKLTSKHTLIYSLGNIATKLIGVILIPIYTNEQYLSIADYGVLALLEASLQILTGVLNLSMSASLSRWYWDAAFKKYQKSIFFTTLAFISIFGGFAVMCIHLSLPFWSRTLFDSEEYIGLLKLVIMITGLRLVTNQTLALLKLQLKSTFYSTIQIVKLAIVLGLTIYGVVVKHDGLNAIWLAALVGEALLLISLIPYIIKNIELKIKFDILKEMVTYGTPLMLASLASVLLSVADRYMLSSMSGLESTAVYSLGNRIANTLKLVITHSLTTAIGPLNMKKMSDPNRGRFYSKMLTYSSFIFMLAFVVVSLFTIDLFDVLKISDNYHQAIYIIPIISFSLLFGLIRTNVTIGLIIKKKTNIIGSLIIISLLINIGLNLLLIPLFDIYGASISTLLSQFFIFFFASRQAQKVCFFPYEWKKLIGLCISSIIIVFIGLYVNDFSIIIRISLKALLLASFLIILRKIKFFDQIEIDAINKILKTWKNPKHLSKNIKQFLSNE